MQNIAKILTCAGALAALALGTGGIAGAQTTGEGASVALPSTVSFPDWMAGSWIEEKDEQWAEEYWTAARGDIMLGVARSGKGARLAMWEATQIRLNKDGKLALYAMPRGAPASAFPVAGQTATSITFENKAHDYPQRIRYWRDGELLKAEISLADGSKAFGWTMQQMRESH